MSAFKLKAFRFVGFLLVSVLSFYDTIALMGILTADLKVLVQD